MDVSTETKPNCYKCRYRGNVPGSAHSCCKHPTVKVDSNSFGAIVDLLAGRANDAIKELGISGDPHGVHMGWFLWPGDFDPVWLRSCNGFTEEAA